MKKLSTRSLVCCVPGSLMAKEADGAECGLAEAALAVDGEELQESRRCGHSRTDSMVCGSREGVVGVPWPGGPWCRGPWLLAVVRGRLARSGAWSKRSRWSRRSRIFR
ncbi:hypothetical protein DL95DRAFT_391061, partial [Leptodontidium sp. 2 PMI_412]